MSLTPTISSFLTDSFNTPFSAPGVLPPPPPPPTREFLAAASAQPDDQLFWGWYGGQPWGIVLNRLSFESGFRNSLTQLCSKIEQDCCRMSKLCINEKTRSLLPHGQQEIGLANDCTQLPVGTIMSIKLVGINQAAKEVEHRKLLELCSNQSTTIALTISGMRFQCRKIEDKALLCQWAVRVCVFKSFAQDGVNTGSFLESIDLRSKVAQLSQEQVVSAHLSLTGVVPVDEELDGRGFVAESSFGSKVSAVDTEQSNNSKDLYPPSFTAEELTQLGSVAGRHGTISRNNRSTMMLHPQSLQSRCSNKDHTGGESWISKRLRDLRRVVPCFSTEEGPPQTIGLYPDDNRTDSFAASETSQSRFFDEKSSRHHLDG